MYCLLWLTEFFSSLKISKHHHFYRCAPLFVQMMYAYRTNIHTSDKTISELARCNYVLHCSGMVYVLWLIWHRHIPKSFIMICMSFIHSFILYIVSIEMLVLVCTARLKSQIAFTYTHTHTSHRAFQLICFSCKTFKLYILLSINILKSWIPLNWKKVSNIFR